MSRKKIIVKNRLSLGDVVVSTSVIRDLFLQHNDKFSIDYRGSAKQVFENNPYLTPLKDGEAEIIELKYPIIKQTKFNPVHFIQAYHPYLSEQLGVEIKFTRGAGDIHLSKEEINSPNPFQKPYWLIVSGGKKDFTNKWWDWKRYQKVVDELKGRVNFVQVGKLNINNEHPELDGCINMLNQTSVRELINLVYHAEGILCGVTSLMHLAAAVPTKTEKPRACVVVAGAREETSWEAYPWHQYIHRQGTLPCCYRGGCWKSRIKPREDVPNEKHDNSLCELPIEIEEGRFIPKCMDMISANDVLVAIEHYIGQ